MRKRKLYLSELLKRYKELFPIEVIINEHYYYESVLTCLQETRESYMKDSEIDYYRIIHSTLKSTLVIKLK